MKKQFWALVILALLAIIPAAESAVTGVSATVSVNGAPALQVNGIDVVQLGQQVDLDTTATTGLVLGGITAIQDTSELPVFAGDTDYECDYAPPALLTATCSVTYTYALVPADDVDTITLLGQDSGAGTLSTTHDIFVNAPPVLVVGAMPAASLATPYSEDFLSATDPNVASTLTFSALGLPAGMSINAATGRVSGTPTAAGTSSVKFTVEDGYGGTNSRTVNFVVASLPQANQAPMFDSTPNTAAMSGQQYSYTAHATDANGDTLTYALVGPVGMTVDRASGFVRWVPQSTQLGSHDVTINVTDGKGGSDTQSFTVTVSSQSLVVRNLEASADKVKPASNFNVEIEIKNLWGADAENVKATIILKGIDNGADLTQDVEFGKIAKKDTETGTATFSVPVDAKEGTYQVTATVAWENEDGVEFSTDSQRTDKVKVERTLHEIAFLEVAVLPASVRGGDSAQVGFRLANVGEKDENVRVTVKSDALAIDAVGPMFKLEQGKETVQFVPFKLSGDAVSGNYLFQVTAAFGDGSESVTNTTVLEVIRAAPAAQTLPAQAAPVVEVAATGAVTVQQPQASAVALDTNVVVAVGIIAAAIVITIAILVTALVPPRAPTPPRSIVIKGRRAQ
jgi:hypothetical protein